MHYPRRRHATVRRSWPRLLAIMVRALPLAITLATHLLVLIMLTLPAVPMTPPTGAPAPRGAALEVRWLRAPPRTTELPPPPSSRHRSRAGPAKAPTVPRALSSAVRDSTPSHTDASPLQLTLPTGRPDYIRGGDRLRNRLSSVHREARLPGQEAVPHAPIFRMIDPRTRGAQGLVRLIGSLTGAVDPRCIELSKWQGLSIQERAAAHITDKAMADVEREHGCEAPAARVGPGINPLPGR